MYENSQTTSVSSKVSAFVFVEKGESQKAEKKE